MLSGQAQCAMCDGDTSTSYPTSDDNLLAQRSGVTVVVSDRASSWLAMAVARLAAGVGLLYLRLIMF